MPNQYNSKWGPEIGAYIAEIAPGRSRKEIAEMVSDYFGIECTRNNILWLMTKFGITTGRRHVWTEEEKAYLAEICQGRSMAETAAMMTDRFGGDHFTEMRISAAMGRYGLFTGRDCKFQKGSVPANKGKKCPSGVGGNSPGAQRTQFKKGERNGKAKKVYREIGTDVKHKDGYWWRKIADFGTNPDRLQDSYREVHKIVWEEANGPVPDGHKVIFLDGDRDNLAIDNLCLVTDGEHGTINRWGLRSQDPKLTKVGIAVAKVKIAAGKRRRKTNEQGKRNRAGAGTGSNGERQAHEELFRHGPRAGR